MDIIDRLDTYMYSSDELRNIEVMVEAAEFMEMDMEALNEAFNLGMLKSGAKELLKKAGIHAGQESNGLIQVALKSGKVMAQFIYYALKAAAGNEEAKAKVKELANTEIKKEDVLDFLLKLDQATLHVVTGPIHMIDSLTGWHIWANVHKKAQSSLKKAKEALSALMDAAKGAEDKVKKRLKAIMKNIASIFGLEAEKKAIAAV